MASAAWTCAAPDLIREPGAHRTDYPSPPADLRDSPPLHLRCYV